MSRAQRLDGLEQVNAFFDLLPTAAHEEMVVELGIIGREISAAQHNDAPMGVTGELRGALGEQVEPDALRVLVGFIKGVESYYSGVARRNGSRSKGRAAGPFYAPIVEGGRQAQTVLVTRRVKSRRINGNGTESERTVTYLNDGTRVRRRGPNRGSLIGSPYKMRVRGRAAHPFVAQPLLMEAAELHLSDFWSQVLTRTGAN